MGERRSASWSTKKGSKCGRRSGGSARWAAAVRRGPNAASAEKLWLHLPPVRRRLFWTYEDRRALIRDHWAGDRGDQRAERAAGGARGRDRRRALDPQPARAGSYCGGIRRAGGRGELGPHDESAERAVPPARAEGKFLVDRMRASCAYEPLRPAARRRHGAHTVGRFE